MSEQAKKCITIVTALVAAATATIVIGMARDDAARKVPQQADLSPQFGVELASRPAEVVDQRSNSAVIRIPSYPQAMPVGRVTSAGEIQLCQAFCPAPARHIDGVDCQTCDPCREALWNERRPIPWEVFAQGEYVGPHRPQHVPEYRLRVDDTVNFVYRLTRNESSKPYELNVGDTIRVESLIDENLDRELLIQPDGTVTLRLLGQVRAARRTVDELRQDIEERYKKYYPVPEITITPLKVNTKLEDLRAAVDSRFGAGGQSLEVRVTPDGTIQLPAIGSVLVQGLTLAEVKREVDERYGEIVDGIEVEPVLRERAPRFIFVLGEVTTPNRYELVGPTTLMGAITLAGGWNNGGNLREIVVFRRAEDWRLIATKIDIQGALLGKRPCPADEIWLRDSDIVVVPKTPIQLIGDFADQYFTRVLYTIIPMQSISLNFSKASTL